MKSLLNFIALELAALMLTHDGWAATREYYIQAEDVRWDFAPSEKNLAHGGPIPKPWTHSHSFRKTRYFEYTNSTYQTRKPQPEWLGVLGPIIRAEVGDKVVVHFRNMAKSGFYGMHPHGFRYDKDNEGAHYDGVNSQQPPGAGAAVDYGKSFDYVWNADAESGPAPNDPSSIVWWYHSHLDETFATNAGLLGPIIITRKGEANPDATPKGVDREFVLAFFIFDQLKGEEKGLMHSINGYIFGNLKGLVMREGEKVRWYLMGMGNEKDLHSAHWHGKTVTAGCPEHAQRMDVVPLLPGGTSTVDMQADNVGEWMLHCHVADHIAAGMLTTYQILPANNQVPPRIGAVQTPKTNLVHEMTR